MSTASPRSEIPAAATVVLHVGRQYRASEKAVVEAVLLRLAGVVAAEANPVAQTATVRYDPSLTSVAELRRAVESCDFECAGLQRPGLPVRPAARAGPARAGARCSRDRARP